MNIAEVINSFEDRLKREFGNANIEDSGSFHDISYMKDLNSIEILITEDNIKKSNSNLFVLKVFMVMVGDEIGLTQLVELKIKEWVLKIIDSDLQFHTYRIQSSRFAELYQTGLKLKKSK